MPLMPEESNISNGTNYTIKIVDIHINTLSNSPAFRKFNILVTVKFIIIMQRELGIHLMKMKAISEHLCTSVSLIISTIFRAFKNNEIVFFSLKRKLSRNSSFILVFLKFIDINYKIRKGRMLVINFVI